MQQNIKVVCEKIIYIDKDTFKENKPNISCRAVLKSDFDIKKYNQDKSKKDIYWKTGYSTGEVTGDIFDSSERDNELIFKTKQELITHLLSEEKIILPITEINFEDITLEQYIDIFCHFDYSVDFNSKEDRIAANLERYLNNTSKHKGYGLFPYYYTDSKVCVSYLEKKYNLAFNNLISDMKEKVKKAGFFKSKGCLVTDYIDTDENIEKLKNYLSEYIKNEIYTTKKKIQLFILIYLRDLVNNEYRLF